MLQIVIDTNVFVAALRSQYGASYKLIQLVDTGKFELNLSVPIVFEYEDVAKRASPRVKLSTGEIDDILDYLCQVSNLREIYFLWRPFLSDPKDDMVLELAIAAQCKYIVTFNAQDFIGSEQFGVIAVSPQEFLRLIGEAK